MKTTVVKLRPEIGSMLKEEAARRRVYMNELVEALILASLAAEKSVDRLVRVTETAKANGEARDAGKKARTRAKSVGGKPTRRT